MAIGWAPAAPGERFNGGLGAVSVSRARCRGVLTLRRSPHVRLWRPLVVPSSSSRVWWPALRVSGRLRVQPGALVASGLVAAPAGVDRRRRGRRWAGTGRRAEVGRHWRRAEVGLVAGMVDGCERKEAPRHLILMWRRLNFRARARKKWTVHIVIIFESYKFLVSVVVCLRCLVHVTSADAAFNSRWCLFFNCLDYYINK